MKTKAIQLLFLLTGMVLLLSSCKVAQPTQSALNLASCEFRLLSAEKIIIAGISVDQYSSVRDLGVADFAMIMGALTQPELPLSLQLNIEVKNPNTSSAGINSLEYIIFIDDIQMVEGRYDKPVIVPASSTTVIPVQLNMELKQALKGKSMDAILNFGFNLAGMGSTPTRFKVKLKPGILIGNTSLYYPGFITVKTEFVNGSSL